MRRALVAAVAALALALAGNASAALVIAPYDPTGNCTVNTWSHGVLHLEKKCTTSTNAAAGADITGFAGQTFVSASFTLASTSQCNGGSPRFDILDANGKVFFLGCNNVTPTINANGTATYNFTMADLLRINPTLGTPGAIQAVDVAVDVQGVADISRIYFNGVRQVVASSKNECKRNGWKSFKNPSYRNQGQCIKHRSHEDDGKHKSDKAKRSGEHEKSKHEK
jgi:hypothetical protein